MATTTKLASSSGVEGFFQDAPHLTNQYQDDHILRQLLNFYLPASTSTHTELAAFGEEVIQPEVFALISDAERNIPTISTHTTFGRPRTTLHTSHGWRELQNKGIAAGMVAIPYDTSSPDASRIKQFLKYHIWSASSAIVTCPSAMTDGAATLMRKHLTADKLEVDQRAVFSQVFERLTSYDPSKAWTSGQWMTERSGGSDIRGTETVATHTGEISGLDAHGMKLGPWRVSGFKWFSSATDSQMTILLAKTDKGGLSAFYAPMRRTAADGSIEMNGVSIQRLKPKMGTKPLPTAELVLDGVRAWLVGKEGDGVREISAILNITRIHNAISAMGFWGRALAISRAYARVRKVSGKLLQDNPSHVTTMARNTVDYAAHMQLGFFVVKLLDVVEHPDRLSSDVEKLIQTQRQATLLLRLLTPVAKAQCSKKAIYGIQECMESLGGVGYIEDEQEFNIARLFRDCCVLSIWEGTTDVMADDVVRVVRGREGVATCEAVAQWVEMQTGNWSAEHWQGATARLNNAVQRFNDMAASDISQLRVQGRRLLDILSWVVGGVLLYETARMTRDENTLHMAQLWTSRQPETLSVAEPQVEKSIVFGQRENHTSKL